MKTIIDFEFHDYINTARETLKSIPKELELEANICIKTIFQQHLSKRH